MSEKELKEIEGKELDMDIEPTEEEIKVANAEVGKEG